MSGWIRMEKALLSDVRFRRVVRQYCNGSNALPGVAVTVVLGALTQLWLHADEHIRDDDTLRATADDINDLVGIEGFCQMLPGDWLVIVDADHVKLPDFLVHNGSSAKLRKQNAERQARFRNKHITEDEHSVTQSNARNAARPDHPRPDKTKPESKNGTAAKPLIVSHETEEWFLDFKLAYPDRAGDPNWRGALRAANARIAEGHHPNEFLRGASAYAKFCEATGKVGTEYVKQAATFLGPGKPFLEPWTLPATSADNRLRSNLSEAEEFMRRTDSTENAA